ncbi:hypothetical protein [Salinarimonas rosea]|uniref:hypothetical protein n=1 Tax=Salinarimonas rosea TaxID=552063 RepID=UPI0004009B09|nr:hypothetical protein [Salinarimonas rosea]
MRVPLFIRQPAIVRLGAAQVQVQARASARPAPVQKGRAHPPETVALVRSLIEGTIDSHRELAARTGVDSGTISRWAARHGWTRPPGACRPAPRPPEARYTRNRIGRTLAREILAACTRLVDAIEADPRPDPAALAEALDLLARARAESRVRRRRRLNPPTSPPPPERKPKRRPGDPPITRRSRRALREALRTMQGLRPGDTLERELADQLRPPPPPRRGRVGR